MPRTLSQVATSLILPHGTGAALRFYPVDRNGVSVDISDFTSVRFSIGSRPGEAPIVDRTTLAGDVVGAIEDGLEYLEIDPITSEEWEDLPPGQYVAQAWLTDASGNAFGTELVRVVVQKSMGGPS